MKTIPRLLCLFVLLSASGIVSGIDRVSTRRLHLIDVPGSSAQTRTTAGIGWQCVTPAPIGPAATAGHAGQAVHFGF